LTAIFTTKLPDGQNGARPVSVWWMCFFVEDVSGASSHRSRGV
jgi:hypothetical protein